MEVKEAKPPSGYGKPPWEFKGSALYQLHLVKSETARAFIPKEFKLVEAFGYTLGGFFLASYDDSPAGIFDGLVVIAGIVWNPPTSCAWAARVLVNSDEACVHGRKDVGLPSQVARFSKQRITPIARQSENNSNRFLRMIGVGTVLSHPKNCLDIQVTEINGTSATDICTINVGTAGKLDLGQGSTRAKFQQVDWASYQDVTSKLQVVSAFVCITKPLFVETNLYFIYYIAVDVQSIILIFLNILAKLSAG
ncbi:hypothetical protein RHGRI_034085 [Rhododendron griersonianum]|uniref:Protein NEOXANTHIN-DEFICIENT 1 n=1 Tax=Rhododendron griersonianum TaxID=479676 RepID=A0AAV6I3P4_9ERIC|nr:hypothetical protein RHGRI_034085 [Rhododendron griersonianum]